MQIPIDSFERYVNSTIIKRATSYYENGNVIDVAETRPGEFEATVEGSEDYTVQLKLEDGKITEYDCDCPYDMGPVCKHIVAVIMHLQENGFDADTDIDNDGAFITPLTAKQEPSRNQGRDQVSEIIENIHPDELKQFIQEASDADPNFRSLFLSTFSQHNSNDYKEIYKQQVKSILDSNSDRHGFVNWSAAGEVNFAVEDLLRSAEKQIENHNYESAVYICTAVMEEMTEALEYADDSSGNIGGCIEYANELLFKIATEQTDEKTRKMIIEYSFSAFESKIFEGWDWHLNMLRMTALLLKTPEEIERIYVQIDNANDSDYLQKQAESIKYNIILNTVGEKEADEYLEQHITNHYFRHIAIQKAFDNKDYSKAIAISNDGIDYDAKDRPGLVKDWVNWLLKIAQAQNNTEKIIEHARYLYIDNFMPEQDYYQVLKDTINSENWNSFVEGLIHELSKKNNWGNDERIASIYIEEQWWDRLMEFVEQSHSLRTIENYEKYLAKDYTTDLVELYSAKIIKYMEHNVGRSHYQTICRYLRRIIKLGAKEKANETAEFLRNKYKNRRAMLEELKEF